MCVCLLLLHWCVIDLGSLVLYYFIYCFFIKQIWKREQQRMIKAFHPHSFRTTLPGSDYVSLYQHAELVAQTILDMVKDWRQYSRAAQ